MRPAFQYRFDHLVRMTDERGLLEHAFFDIPRHESGYCTDDNARLLTMTCQEEHRTDAVATLQLHALHFVLMAVAPDGQVHNRYGHAGTWRWLDEPSNGDWWGRATASLAIAARDGDRGISTMARWGFERAAQQRSPWTHATAFAMVGAAELLDADPGSRAAETLVRDGISQLTASGLWDGSRLSYANASLPEALIAGGAVLGDESALARGLDELAVLADLQTRDGHISPVGVGGRAHGDTTVQFDQQAIEVTALADAAYRAWTLTGDKHWADTVMRCAAWFEGCNDVGCVMYDTYTGGGYDGLTPTGPNLNQGAESTLALISTFQRAQALAAQATAASATSA